jgi:hypothetical protein
MMEQQPHAFGVDDNAAHLPVGKVLFQIVFSVWVTLTEQNWVVSLP